MREDRDRPRKEIPVSIGVAARSSAGSVSIGPSSANERVVIEGGGREGRGEGKTRKLHFCAGFKSKYERGASYRETSGGRGD